MGRVQCVVIWGEQDGLELEGGLREERYSRDDLDAILIHMTGAMQMIA